MGNGMERIWNFFENMNEYVYVADADTHELVYMSDTRKQVSRAP